MPIDTRHVRLRPSAAAIVPVTLAILAELGMASSVWAQAATPLPPLVVTAASPDEGLAAPLSGSVIAGDDLATKRTFGDDTAKLLANIPGVGIASGGGVSGLPVIHGLADDRVKTMVNGVPVIAACPNHMNPALSAISPSGVSRIDLFAGITPVSVGGDSIAGTIVVEKAPPVFAASGDGVHTEGSVSSIYRSNNHGLTLSGNVTAATENTSIGYDGSWARAGNYHRGGGDPVLTSEYQTESHAITLAARNDLGVLSVEGGWQFTPYEGFPNQYMDLTDNKSTYANVRYQGDLAWGKLDTRGYWRDTEHEMNFLGQVKGTDMPMNTDSTQLGYSVKAEVPVSARDLFRVGNEFDRFKLDDWWPGISGSMMMGPNAFWNINDGTRNRVGTFAEWEAKLTDRWTTLIGVRNDTVWMNAGEVQGYGSSYAAQAASFNASDRSKTDINFDLTALTRYEADKTSTYEAGYARKTRSPSLYERYTWSTNGMALKMNNWVGDGNGYIGDVDLKPEVAHTVSVTGDWHDSERKLWGLKVTPYYTYVQNYIDADRLAGQTGSTNFVNLQLANHDAQLYGADVSGEIQAWNAPKYGRGLIKASVGWVNGENLDTGDNLYNVMPLHGRLALEHRLDGWNNTIEATGATSKTAISHVRNEAQTPGYVLINLRTGYDWDNLSLTFGIDNLFDRLYHLPLGGADLSDTGSTWGYNTFGEGRSYVAGLTARF